jgi:phage terminase large subunit-like protein
MSPLEAYQLQYDWNFWGRPNQQPPEGDWTYWLILAGRGFGKRLCVETPIPTPDGWKPMGELVEGDEIFDEMGHVCRVVKAHEIVMEENAWRVTFSDGQTIDACGEHLWLTQDRSSRKAYERSANPSKHPSVVTTQQIAKTLRCGKEKNHSIECSRPLETPFVLLPIDPYVFGYWLGDGTSKAAEITCCDADIDSLRSKVISAGYFFGNERRKDGANCATYWLSNNSEPKREIGRFSANDSIHTKLKRLGVLNNKHIPVVYLRSSKEQRLELLKGLLDSDGYCDPITGNVEFCTTRKDLADGVFELVCSLGLKPTVQSSIARLYDKDCGIKYRMNFTSHFNVFFLHRKSKNQKGKRKQSKKIARRYITNCVRIEPKLMRCITVDSPSNLYLCGRAMIPTHNTRTGAEWVRKTIRKFPLVNLIGATLDDARDIMIEGESGILAICPNEERPKYVDRELRWPNGAKSLIFTADEPERLRGKQHMALWCLIGSTNVLMADGTNKPIKDVMQDDYVMTRKGSRRVIASALTNYNAEVYSLTVMGGQTIAATADHPVFVIGKGFVPLFETKIGDQVCVITAADANAPLVSTTKIVSVEKLANCEPVYDLAIEGEPEFFANGILVHNCDELSAWRYPESWDQAMFGLRLGACPRACITTTPKPVKILRDLIGHPRIITTKGTTYDNRENLSPSFFDDIITKYEGTRLGRQELNAELLDDMPGALWQRARIDELRLKEAPPLSRICIAIDPAVSTNDGSDETGIIAAGVDIKKHAYVLGDYSGVYTPQGWGAMAVRQYHAFKADFIIAEANNGGDLVEANIRAVDPNVPVKLVHASRGKFIRAEPVAALAEQGRYHHVGGFNKLEDQMCSFTVDFDRKKMGFSPDRMDAMVWAMHELILIGFPGSNVMDYIATQKALAKL